MKSYNYDYILLYGQDRTFTQPGLCRGPAGPWEGLQRSFRPLWLMEMEFAATPYLAPAIPYASNLVPSCLTLQPVRPVTKSYRFATTEDTKGRCFSLPEVRVFRDNLIPATLYRVISTVSLLWTVSSVSVKYNKMHSTLQYDTKTCLLRLIVRHNGRSYMRLSFRGVYPPNSLEQVHPPLPLPPPLLPSPPSPSSPFPSS